MRGKSRVVTCYFCKKKIPQYKAIMTYRRLFSYKDDKYNIMYFGPTEKIWVCRSCARHRGIVDVRQKMKRNQFRERSMNNYGYVEHRKPKQKEESENKEIKDQKQNNWFFLFLFVKRNKYKEQKIKKYCKAPWCSGQACRPLEPVTGVRIPTGLHFSKFPDFEVTDH